MIEKLKALESKAFPGPWFVYAEEGVQVLEKKDADFICALRNIAPELIALWEAVNRDPQGVELVVGRDVLDRLNAKAKEVL